jgi:hypothetical protein
MCIARICMERMMRERERERERIKIYTACRQSMKKKMFL